MNFFKKVYFQDTFINICNQHWNLHYIFAKSNLHKNFIFYHNFVFRRISQTVIT